MSESDRLNAELAEMEENMTRSVSTLTEKIQKIQRLDSKLNELLKETNSEKKSKAKLSEIHRNQAKVMRSFNAIETKLDNYKKMAKNIASKAIHFQIFVNT